LVTYRTGKLLKFDVLTAVLQVAAAITLASAGAGPVAVAAAVSGSSILNNVMVALAAERMLEPGGGRFSRTELLKRSLPLGAMSVMTRVYLTIDLVLLGLYVSGTRLGDYAAASKLLTVLAGLSGAVMSGALPALSSSAAAREELGQLTERLWHWLMVTALPMFGTLALFAPLLIDVTLGHGYRGAVTLVRILCIAGAISVVSNLVGNLMVAQRRMRPLFVQNTLAIIVNIAGNVVLIPTYGVYAAAWMTAITEALVCCASIFSLRNELPFGSLARVSARPAAAAALACAVAIPILGSPWLAAAAASMLFIGGLTAFGAWPHELRPVGWISDRVRLRR
jgi:O-antigen/teichoic acid export membrane protein